MRLVFQEVTDLDLVLFVTRGTILLKKIIFSINPYSFVIILLDISSFKKILRIYSVKNMFFYNKNYFHIFINYKNSNICLQC